MLAVHDVPLADLVGAAEIADRSVVSVATVRSWRARHDDFPEPVLTLSMGALWSWTEVERWLLITGRKRRQERLR